MSGTGEKTEAMGAVLSRHVSATVCDLSCCGILTFGHSQETCEQSGMCMNLYTCEHLHLVTVKKHVNKVACV